LQGSSQIAPTRGKKQAKQSTTAQHQKSPWLDPSNNHSLHQMGKIAEKFQKNPQNSHLLPIGRIGGLG
jgi:hypothetical protein